MHPSDDIRGSLSTVLSERRLVLAMSGSVAVMRSVELIRLLMRHGAIVYPVMSRAACRLVGPDLVHWASGQKPITRLSGEIEHVALAGNVAQPVDLVLVAPATANTIGKIAAGIDDTPVTTFVTTAWGQGLPIVLVPAMHQSMYEHPLVVANLKKLEELGIHLVMPTVAEGKAKFPPLEQIFEEVARLLCQRSSWKGKRVIITVGRTEEPLDPVRLITNPSSGKMGMALARQVLRRGATVDLVVGQGQEPLPFGVRQVVRCKTAEQMANALSELLCEPADVVIAAAAVGDWKPREVALTKVPTQGNSTWVVELVPTVKVVDVIKPLAPQSLVVQFRALSQVSVEQAAQDASERIQSGKTNFVAFNDVGQPNQGFGADTNRILLFGETGLCLDTGLVSKDEAASKILDEIEKKL